MAGGRDPRTKNSSIATGLFQGQPRAFVTFLHTRARAVLMVAEPFAPRFCRFLVAAAQVRRAASRRTTRIPWGSELGQGFVGASVGVYPQDPNPVLISE